ncbi:MAG: sigma-70 family RNA polymerase sigma factor [Sphingobium sp.]
MSDRAAALDIGGVYAAHGHWLQSWLRRRTRCPHRASDLVQDTFCRIIERRPAEPLTDPRRYLAVIARRLLIDDVRRREIERAYLDTHAELHGDTDDLTPERIAAATQLLDGIMLLLGALSAQVRVAFLLRRVDGLSHAEIAEELGVSERTVKRHIARAYAACYEFAYPT